MPDDSCIIASAEPNRSRNHDRLNPLLSLCRGCLAVDYSGGVVSAHTPGPWEVRTRGAAFSSNEIRAKAFEPNHPTERISIIPLAWVAKLNDGEANACLIAAAPDLLAVLESLIEMADKKVTTMRTHEIANAARNAIAKARGGK